ncbi:hypothetical protein M404DRAFT_993494 [Pisolithus tinctorius Marx 270]|uniref:Uncharacterized protein n=1 Tax=Pisolithus tinctorius Marx 270 TaxID=870435 RepID=A0A0C3PF57_PISTI|nr:hypothetical protein M404DRAFT_993494 [Pisolithus tinctorius Marx 270]
MTPFFRHCHSLDIPHLTSPKVDKAGFDWFLIVIGDRVVSKECLDDNKNESSSVGISSVRAQSPNVRFP